MIRRLPWLLFSRWHWLLLLPCCARTEAHDSSANVASASASVSAPPIVSVAPSASPPPVASVVVPVVDAGPPRQVVQGDGITITELGSGEVVLKTTSLWNETIETTYASCDYYKGAIAVLKRQLREDRAKLLPTVCAGKK
jgi:hypothetical protein